MPEIVAEFDKSLNDFIDQVRREFEKAFPYVYNSATDMNSYFYVTDVFKDYLVCKSGEKYYEVSFTRKDDIFTFDPKDQWKAVKLSYVQEMMTGAFRDVMFITEFKGSYPEVKIFEDIDLQELTGGEKNPVFATLPIGMANVTSGNGRFYDDKFVTEQEKQVREKRPIGIMGHIPKDQRSTSFPAEAVHWVGTLRVNELLWGKGYFPDGEARKRLQRYKATKKKIATSIDASADGVWDNQLGAYRMIAETLDLKQIDIAPADRAGIGDLAAVPLITQEMLDERVSVYTVLPIRGDDMGKEETIREMTTADISLLPESVRNSIIASYSSDIKKALGLPESADVSRAVQEMAQEKEKTAQKAVTLRITELLGDDTKGIKVPSVKGVVEQLVLAKSPKTIQEAESFYDEIVAGSHVQELLKMTVQESMGPSVTTPIPGQKLTPPAGGKYFVHQETRTS